MEQNDKTKISTKETEGVRISQREAEEYRAYKRQKKVAEIMSAIARSASPIDMKDDIKKLVDRAARFRQAAVKVTPVVFAQVQRELSKSCVGLDCIVGGNGETTAKVKAYEAKLAVKAGARELTLVLSSSHIFTGRYGEIRKEARIARLASEMGVDYVCVPYFFGCERLRYDLLRTCGLEVSEVETLDDFKKMAGAGVERIVTTRVLEIYTEWMKEAETLSVETQQPPVKALLPAPAAESEKSGKTEKTPSSELKFV